MAFVGVAKVEEILPGQVRSFEIEDLFGNILGVVVAYSIVKIYLFFNKP